MSQQTGTSYSARSQRSLIVESGLRKEIRKIDATIERFRNKGPELQASKSFLTKKVVVEDQHSMQPQLDNKLVEIANMQGVIKACEEERERTQEAIRKLDPGPVELQARLIRQRRLAQLASDRLDRDRKAGELLKELREVLRERAEITSRMAETATALELAMPKDDLDAVMGKLSDSLPQDLVTASERWHGWFLGKQNGAKPYVVVDEHLLVCETLAHDGHYKFGDLIQLTEEEAGKLVRVDRPAAKGERRNVWTYAPPSIMTVEAFEAAAKTAKGKGTSVETAVFWSEVAFDAMWKNQYKAENKMSPPATVEPIASFESTMKIEARAKVRMVTDRQYETGDIIELTGKPLAWRMVESGMIGPP